VEEKMKRWVGGDDATGGVFLKIRKGEKRVELRCLEGGTCVLKENL
jgi:hypothetical protein